MQGYQRTILAALATLLLANAVFAQEIPPVTAPVITNVTPGDRSAVIGFVPSTVSEDTNPVREYIVSCETVGNRSAGVIETTADVESLVGNTVDVQGLTNRNRYECTMIGRSVTGGLIPRSINSESSNPSPVFSPSVEGGSTIFVGQDRVEEAVSEVTTAVEPPTAEEPAAEAAEEPAAEAAEEPTAEAAEEPAAEPAEEPAAEATDEALVLEVPVATPTTTPPSESTDEAPVVEEVKDAPISSAIRAAASAIVAGVVTAAAFVV